MTDLPVSRPARRLAPPGWLDGRLLLGVLLVLVSVVLGARVLAGADRAETVWAATRDLAPGTLLRAADLTRVRVRLFDHAGSYLRASGPSPAGYLLERSVSAGELLPYRALTPAGMDESIRFLTVPVARGHLPPDLAAGRQVDVYVTPGSASATTTGPAGPPRLVVRNATVLLRQSTSSLAGASEDEPVVLRVRTADVPALLVAMSQGRIDLVEVPPSAQTETSGPG